MKFGAFSSLLAILALVCSFVVDAKYTRANHNNFDSLVTNAKNPVALFFCADWSSSCRNSLPVVEKAVGKKPKVTMVYVDAFTHSDIVAKYKVREIPTLKGIYKNKIVNSKVGPISQDQADKVVGDLAAKSP